VPVSERKSYNVGVWKIPYEERDIAHAVITDYDDRGFFDVINADDDDSIPVGARCTYRVDLTDEEAEQFRTASNVRYVELDGVSTADGYVDQPIPSDSTLDFMGALDLSEEWHGRDSVIAIVDSGTTQAVRDYMNWTLVARKVFDGNSASPVPDPGDGVNHPHGCLTSADGVPYGGKIMDLICATPSGSISNSNAVAAFKWAADRGCKIISYSYSGDLGTESNLFDDGMRYLLERDVQIFCSTGNDGLYGMGVPASYSKIYPNVHSLGNINQSTGAVSTTSNHHVEMSGVTPGSGGVWGLTPEGTPTQWTGTSASAPHAARLCAMGATGGSFTPRQVAEALDRNTRDTGNPDTEQGHGAYDLSLAMADLMSATPLPDPSVTDREWKIVSGPEDVNSVIGTGITLEWTPDAEGDYVIRYTAENPAGIGTDDLAIHVDPAPIPIIDLGSDGSVLQYSTFTRTAIETGGGDIFYREWVIESGPAGVGTILDNDVNLSWTPTVAGSYVLRYNADNPRGRGTNTLTVTVDVLPVPIPSAGTDVPSLLNRTQFSRTGSEIAQNITARSWKILSGATGSNVPLSTAALVQWTPSVPGNYVLRYSVTNAAGTGFDDVSVTVVPVVVPISGRADSTPDLDGALAVVSAFKKHTLKSDGAIEADIQRNTPFPRTQFTSETLVTKAKLTTVTISPRIEIKCEASVPTHKLISHVHMRGKASSEAKISPVITGRIRIFPETTAQAEAIVKKAEVLPPYTWRGFAESSASGNLLSLKLVKGSSKAKVTSTAKLQRRMFLDAEIDAHASLSRKLTRVTVAQEESTATVNPVITKKLTVSTPFDAREDFSLKADASVTSVFMRLGVHGATVKSETSIEPVDLLFITGLGKKVTAETTGEDSRIQRVTLTGKEQVTSASSVTFNRPLGRVRKLPKRVVISKGQILPVYLGRVGPMNATISLDVLSSEPNLRLVALLQKQLTAIATASYGHERRVLTTANIIGEVIDPSSKSVIMLSGYVTAQATAEGRVVLGPILHQARAEAEAAGDLLCLKLNSEEIRAETKIVVRHREVKKMSTIIAIMNEDGVYVPVPGPTGPLRITAREDPKPVVFARTFHQMRV
jgi:hypothetical protein